MKRILVFGAGHNQTLLIRACKELGYYTIVTDPNSDAPGKDLADQFAVLPPKDFEAHCQLIEQEHVQGIVTCQMENPLPLMARLAAQYKLLFPTETVIQRARNKFLMKQAFLAGQVPCANGQVIDGLPDLEKLDLTQWQFPLIIKPVDSYSSRGVYRVNSEAELRERYSDAFRYSSTGQVLLEEFLEGPEVSVEAV
nr:ATP-grasp domain-containing protein [Saprospiraceae bacterium]